MKASNFHNHWTYAIMLNKWTPTFIRPFFKSKELKGSVNLFTAVNEKGMAVNLAEMERRHVGKLRNIRFYCPVCKEPLVLKAGSVRIPHFAHRIKSQCFTTEPESARHLQGKKDLFRFCLKNGYESTLEQYLPEIQQRPDVLAIRNGRRYAIEYQCTPISIRSIQQRSDRYLKIGITPIWIIGGYPFVKKLKNSVYELTDFYWSLTKRTGADITLIGYEPVDSTLFVLSNLAPFTSKKVFARLESIPLNNCRIPFYIQDQTASFPYLHWLKEKNKWIQQKVRYGTIVHGSFLKNVYKSGNNPFLLPAVCGLPVPYMESFASAPMIWQFYVWIDCLQKLPFGKKISLKYVLYKLGRRIDREDVLLRQLPFHDYRNWEKAVAFYLRLLVHLSYLRIAGEDLFVKRKMINSLKHTEDRTEEEYIFKVLIKSSYTNKINKKNKQCFLFGEQEK
ncbi:competence protein CoiA family protein [Siminovitchia sp. FSL W7-1587]|uniref:competence protein CoiA n=1 Tax=Siminovitchia sp. FSL W7-1587 TaxID=2954699 RepID=UPI0030D0F7E4